MNPDISQRAIDFDESLRPALALLLEGSYCASEAGQSRWQFAVEIDELRSAGLSKNQIRWLIHKGYASHATEATAPLGSLQRHFYDSPTAVFRPRTCLILTDLGVRFATGLQLGSSSREKEPQLPTSEPPDRIGSKVPRLTPHWDKDARIFRVGGQIVKHFKVPAANQELILSAFEEEGWPTQIDDPLPPSDEIDPKRRLHDAINRLNRNQKIHVIQFCGNGNGTAVSWRILSTTPAIIATESPPNCT